MKLLIFPIIFCSFLFSCKPDITHSYHINNDSTQLIYTAKNNQVEFNEGSVKAWLGANPSTGKLTLNLSLINLSTNPLVLNYAKTEIVTKEGIRTAPKSYGIKKVNIPEESQQSISFEFDPVNSLLLNRKLNIKGDLKPHYELPLYFIHSEKGIPKSNDIITFQLADSVYQDYLASYGQDKGIQIYELAKGEIHEHLFSKNNENQTSLEIREQEILWQNVHSRFSLWQQAGTIHLNLRFFNQSDKVLAINPKKTILSAGLEPLLPLSVADDDPGLRIKGDTWLLPKGARFDYTFHYALSGNNESLSLSPKGIIWDESQSSFFPQSLPFQIDSTFTSPNQESR